MRQFVLPSSLARLSCSDFASPYSLFRHFHSLSTMRFSVSSLLTLLVAATAVAAQPSKRSRPLNPPANSLHEVKWAELAPASTVALTNAKRFAQGLPPLNPKRRNPNRGVHHGVHARQGTRVASAPRSETSPGAPASKNCNILVKDTATGQELGFISKEWNKFAEFGPLESGQNSNALEVSFSAPSDTPSSRIDMVAVNGKSPAHPFVGGAVGYGSDSQDIGNESISYLYLVGTTQTPAGSPPSTEANNSFSEVSDTEAASESAIWSYDPTSRAFTIQWVNTDGTSADADILWSNQEGNELFTLTGDADLFRSTYGVDAPEVSFTCVPTISIPA
ncbi:unnamed protein product [Rhizoctonia solani]|uniref:Uncharacterized protein n=1 Tax=Rhizoctonia solani TaxID=456999 RepID=A0A8H3E2E0_9AGAM|nr:unnamed protein product [Rhizoctonia solani]